MAQLVKLISYPAIFCDGGVIGPNPSQKGGTWAARLVFGHDMAPFESFGTIHPAPWNLEAITNNFSEAYAMLRGLEMVTRDWGGYVYSDSLITLGRFFQGWQWNNMPDGFKEMCLDEVRRVKPAGYCLLDGHPTKKQLADGFGKRGNLVSEHNVWCDSACTEQAKKFISENGGVVLL